MSPRALLLLALGLLAMIGDLTGSNVLKGLGLATAASPAPKVFTCIGSMEPFSTRFYLEWRDIDGNAHSTQVTPELNRRMEGPYLRRNPYGAVLAAGPVLEQNHILRDMSQSVLRHALHDPARLLAEVGIDPARVDGEVTVRHEPATTPGSMAHR